MDDLLELEAYKVHVVRQTDHMSVTGDGTFGTVNQILYNGAPCVAKGLRSVMMGNRYETVVPMTKEHSTSLFDNLVKECVLHSKLRHPNIIQFIGVVYGNVTNNHDLLLVMERIDTNLDSCLEAHPHIPLPIKLSVLRDVSAGLMYLHSFAPPIIHGDLTTTNILLTQDWRAKIADFGNSVDQSTLAIAPGALAYMLPEALTRPQKYDSKLDIFSFGTVALYVGIQTRDADRNKRSDQLQILRAASDGECLYQIVTWCCEQDPSRRPSSHDLNNHLQQLCVQFPVSCRQRTCMEHYQAIESLEKDKYLADNKVLEVQRELEDIKKTHSDEINRLKIEVEDLKSKADLEKAQLQLYEEDFKRERNDRIRAVEALDRMKQELKMSDHTSYYSTLKSNIDLLTKQLKDKEQELQKSHHQVEDLNVKLRSSEENFKVVIQHKSEALREASQKRLDDEAKIIGLENELKAAKEEKDRLMMSFTKVANELTKDHPKAQVAIHKAEKISKTLKERTDEFDCQTAMHQKQMENLQNEIMHKTSVHQKEMENLQNEIMQLKHKNKAATETIEKERMDHQIELTEVKNQLCVVKENLNAMETIMQSQLKDLNGQLNEAKEEIAVKVAQVKQYQKQVEAYKQQTREFSHTTSSSTHLSHYSEPSADHMHMEVNTPHSQFEKSCEVVEEAPPPSHPAPLINPMVPSDAEYTSEHVPETAQAPPSSVSPCEADGDNQEDEKDELPPPIYHTPFQQMHYHIPPVEETPQKHLSMEVPHHVSIAQQSKSLPCKVEKDDRYHMQQHASGTHWAEGVPLPPNQPYEYGAAVTSHSNRSLPSFVTDTALEFELHDISHVATTSKDGTGMDVLSEYNAPLDPNLKCPVCGNIFKKGEIQKFKRHAETCMQ